MLGKYKSFFIIILFLIITAGFFFYTRTKKTPAEEKLFSLPEGVILTEEQQKKFDEAKAILKKNPNDTEAWISIAQVKYGVRDLEGAKKVYLRALELQPTNTLILNNLGDIYNQQKEYEKAASMYLKIIETTPKWVSAYRELGFIYRYHLKERYPEMEEILLKGLEVSKEFIKEGRVDFYAMLAIFYQETEQKQKAIEYYEKVIELDPENEGARIALEQLKQSE